MKWQEAWEIGIEVVEVMSPACDRIMIAGSVRRAKPEPKDIEIVYIPRMASERVDLLNESDAKRFGPIDLLGAQDQVEGMITALDTGSGLMRYLSFFLWFLQSGATDFQIEGRITEAKSGRLVAEFVDRRRHLCNTPFGPNPHNFDDGYAMKITARATAECLAEFIQEGCESLPPT